MTDPSHRPDVSVIIPTHNRCAILKRTLDALGRQTYPSRQMEVLVVADGCTDGTSEMLRCYQALFSLQIIEQVRQGAAAARNRGAAQAEGSLLLFLDDDVVPTPFLVEAHVHAHENKPGQVVIGPYPPATQGQINSYFHAQVRSWWETKFYELEQPDHRFSYQDLLSGNFSIEAERFAHIGGFNTDPVFQAHEDYELGIRLIDADMTFSYVPEAIGLHYETINIRRSLNRARQEGRADVTIGQQYPELRSKLPFVTSLKSMRFRYRAILIVLPLVCSFLGQFLINISLPALAWLEHFKFSHYWHRVYSFVHGYYYWWGVIDRLNSWRNIANFICEGRASQCEEGLIIDINVADGLEKARQLLDQKRPLGAKIWYGDQLVGTVSQQPGAEPLRGAHLRSILTTTLAVPLLEAFALKATITDSKAVDKTELAKSIRAKSSWFGPTVINQMWYEQYSQWNNLKKDRNSWKSLEDVEDPVAETSRLGVSLPIDYLTLPGDH